MNKRLKIFYAFIVVLLCNSCQRELSFEGGEPIKTAVGLLKKDSASNCLPIKINGTWLAGDSVNGSNSIQVIVDITQAGVYKIKTPEINGYYFSAEGEFVNTGQYTITLQAKGKPIKQGKDQFSINFNQSICTIDILVGEKKADAIFDLKFPNGDCIGFIVNGAYIQQTTTDFSNFIELSIDVKQIGPYQISTTIVNGFQFKADGYLFNTGKQLVKLFANGTPLQTGISAFNFIVRADTCTIDVFVNPISRDDYFPRTANSFWTYEIDDQPNDTAKFFSATSTSTILGNTYNIFMVTKGLSTDSSGYYRKAGSKYNRYADIGDFIGFDQPQWQEYTFLDDALPVGEIFRSQSFNGSVTIAPLPPQPMTVRFVSKIISKGGFVDIVSSAGSVRYNDVIVVEEKYERFMAGTWVDITAQVGSFVRYYAKDIGMIRYEAYNSAGALSAQFELREFRVY